MFGLTTTRRLRAELAAAHAETDRQRRRAERAEDAKNTAVYNREQILRQLAEATAANRRLHGRNLELGKRNSALTEADPEYAGRLEQRVARLVKAVARVGAIAVAERRRADHLQQRHDDAVGIPKAGIRDSARWQPGYVEPKTDAKPGVSA